MVRTKRLRSSKVSSEGPDGERAVKTERVKRASKSKQRKSIVKKEVAQPERREKRQKTLSKTSHIVRISIDVLRELATFLDPHESYCLSSTCTLFVPIHSIWTLPASLQGRVERLNGLLGVEQVKFASIGRCSICCRLGASFISKFAVFAHTDCIRQQVINTYYLLKEERELLKNVSIPKRRMSSTGNRLYYFDVVWELDKGILPARYTLEGVCREYGCPRKRWERKSTRAKWERRTETLLFKLLNDEPFTKAEKRECDQLYMNHQSEWTQRASVFKHEKYQDGVYWQRIEEELEAKRLEEEREEVMRLRAAWKETVHARKKTAKAELGISSLKELSYCIANKDLFGPGVDALKGTYKEDGDDLFQSFMTKATLLKPFLTANFRNLKLFNEYHNVAKQCALVAQRKKRNTLVQNNNPTRRSNRTAKVTIVDMKRGNESSGESDTESASKSNARVTIADIKTGHESIDGSETEELHQQSEDQLLSTTSQNERHPPSNQRFCILQ